MNRTSILVLVAAALLSFGSCGNKGQQPQQVVVPDSTVTMPVNRDSAIYGICGDGSAMNTLQLITDIGDTILVSVAEAKDANRCLGGYQTGDRMAVMLRDASTASDVINMSAMLGDWVMPNPLDGSSEMGIRIKEGGVAESIDQPSTIYRSWRLYNGKLELVAVREGGAELEETTLYDIVSIGPDSLVFKDAEDTFEYGRYHEHESHVDVQLEESSFDDFKM